MIDWERVEELRDEVGAEDFREVAEIFLDEVDEVVDKLRGDSSSAELESDLHFLKGSALNLGFRTFGEICARGEQLARAGQSAVVDLGAVVECYAASKQIFVAQTGLTPAA